MKVIASYIFVPLLFITGELYAETIFLKDGKIIADTTITKENDQTIFTTNGEIERSNILRIHYGKFYDKKVFVYLKDKTELKLYKVSEDQFSYTFRTDLYSPIEKQIPKTKIRTVSREKIEQTIVVQKTKLGALYRSALLPGLGQYYKGQFERAYIYWGVLGITVGAATVFAIDYSSKRSTYESLEDGGDFDSAFSDSEVAAGRLNLTLGILGLVYVANLVDVWFGGEIKGAGKLGAVGKPAGLIFAGNFSGRQTDAIDFSVSFSF